MAQAATSLPSTIPSSVLSKLRGLRMKITSWLLIDGLSRVGLVLVALIAADFAVDWLFNLDKAQRVVMLVLCGGGLAYAVYARLLVPLTTSVSDEALCLAVEKHYGRELNDSLISAVQFSRLGEKAAAGVSPQLVRATIDQGAQAAGRVPFGSVVDSQWFVANLGILLASVVLLGGWGFAAARYSGDQYENTNYQLAHIWVQRDILLKDIPWPQNTYLVVEGADDHKTITLPRGESWTMVVTVDERSKERPDELLVDFIMASGARHTEVMEPVYPPKTENADGEGGAGEDSASVDDDKAKPIRFEIHRSDEMEPFKFEARVPGLRGARTGFYKVNLIDPPEVQELKLSTTAPKYVEATAVLEPITETTDSGEEETSIWEGTVKTISVKQGDKVEKGQALLSIQTEEEGLQQIPSPFGGVVKEIHVQQGEEASLGDALVTLHSVVGQLPPGTGPHHVMHGADFQLTGAANKKLSRAVLAWGDDDGARQSIDMDIDDDRFSLTIPFESKDSVGPKLASGGYLIELWDTEDVLLPGATRSGPIKSNRPSRFTLRIVDDRPPEVVAWLKDISGMVLPDATIPLGCRISDEFAVTSVKLHHQWRHQDDPEGTKTGEFDVQPAQDFLGSRSMEFSDNFDLAPLQIPSGSGLSFHIAALDNNNISGPSEGKSTLFLLRVVTEGELREDIVRRQIEQRQDFERLLKMQKDLQLETEVLQADSVDQETFTAKQRQALLQVQKNQKVIGANVGNIAKRLQAIAREMKNNKLDETDEPLLKKLTEQVIQPMQELAEADIPEVSHHLDTARSAGTKPKQQQNREQGLQDAFNDQTKAIEKMEKILTNLEKTEGYQEAVNLLYEIEKTQKLVREQTLKRKGELEDEFFEKKEP